MRTRIKLIQRGMAWGGLFMAVGLLTGCAGTYTSKPQLGFGRFDFQTQLTRADFVVLEAVEATSKDAGYFFGLVRVIEDDKWQILGIKFFEDRYAYPPGMHFPWPCIGPAHRAYYDALAKVPDADAVLEAAATTKVRGFPFLYKITEVTYRGKAVKLKSD